MIKVNLKVEYLDLERDKVYLADAGRRNRAEIRLLDKREFEQFKMHQEYTVTFEAVGEQVDPEFYFKD